MEHVKERAIASDVMRGFAPTILCLIYTTNRATLGIVQLLNAAIFEKVFVGGCHYDDLVRNNFIAGKHVSY